MAKYDITYSCGHQQTVQLYGATAERTRKIEWMRKSGLCPSCYAASKAAEREAALVAASAPTNTASATADTASDTIAAAPTMDALPALEGSEKQIVWARSIRADALIANTVSGYETKMAALTLAKAARAAGVPMAEINTRLDTVIAVGQQALAQLRAERSAKWWIDQRYDVATHVHAAERAELDRLFGEAAR